MGIKIFNKNNLDLPQVGSQFVRQSVGKINKMIAFMVSLGKWLLSLNSGETVMGLIPMKSLNVLK